MRKFVYGLLVGLLLLLLYLFAWPIDAEPQVWQALPAPELTGEYQANNELAAIERLAADQLPGPEDLFPSRDGYLYTGTLTGDVVRVHINSGRTDVLVNTGGRPLGVEQIADGRLVIADADKGLLLLSPSVAGQPAVLQTLLAEWDGKPMLFVDDLAVTQTGKVYFSDASLRWGYGYAAEDIVENQQTGRVIEYDLNTRKARIVVDNLSFANGVALGPNEASLFINETGRYRVHRYWLRGPKAGTQEVFIDNLPGFPDNVSFNPESGLVWVALFGPRNGLLDSLSEQPFLRKALMRLPKFVQPEPEKMAFVLAFDLAGNVVHNLQYRGADAYAPITNVEQVGDQLYFGSLAADGIGHMALPLNP